MAKNASLAVTPLAVLIADLPLPPSIERRYALLIVARVINDALTNGYMISVHNGRKRVLVQSTDLAKIASVMFTTRVDTFWLEKGFSGNSGWIRFEHDRKGYDVIADSSANMYRIVRAAHSMSAMLANNGEEVLQQLEATRRGNLP